MSKPQLYILSDIFGSSEKEWMKEYVRELSPFFEITSFDSRELAGIHTLPQSEVHAEFVNGGIDSAVENLHKIWSVPDAILGFSVGGTIAWKYAQQIPNLRLYLISATRIRNEEVQPPCSVHLYFGELEEHGPKREWFENHDLIPIVIKAEGHECYKVNHLIQQIRVNLLEDFQLLQK
ncbi:MAG: hypothetical protein AB8B56_08785 [Crocinitomicaceae bacterium]